MTVYFGRSPVSCQLTPWGREYGRGLGELAALDVRFVEIGSRLLLPYEGRITEWKEKLEQEYQAVSGVFEFGHFANWARRREIYLHHDRLARLLLAAGIDMVILGPGIRLSRSYGIEDQRNMLAMIAEIHKRYSFHGIRAGIHPHRSHCIYTGEEIEYVMERTPPDLGLVPDTGHLAEAGVDFRELMGRYVARTLAVHLKDVRGVREDEESGAFPGRRMRYAELGGGELPLSSILRTLREYKYAGYMTLEMDETLLPPAEAVKVSLSVLHKV
ncbi:sugar phosphate isomerase/epimerase [Paenibacillus sp. FJAT-26967]|uniref:sugar phosphate isomerase/epimerase family protein n=1 Tax=Paenibacillus sp. FJAT-26967 TaxID=1729690 RepID=UPI000B10839B|nr:sugar phosphate isomerase/epimerase [Paenibacillus sp. FJAT-26967]